MAADSIFSRPRLMLRSLPWTLYIIIIIIITLPSSSAAPSAAHDGHTHPAIQPGDFASIPDHDGVPPEPQPSTGSPAASVVSREEIPFDPHPVVAAGRDTRRDNEEFYRPKRTVFAGEGHKASQADLEDLVSNLKTQLKESQAAQVHTRSIINVLQEKVEAQENDLSIMKNEISQMRREQASQREMIGSLKSSSDDTSWAIASVKHGQDQTTTDLHSLKHLQDHQNETLLVMEEVIMSNALELQNHHRHVGAIRQDLFQLRGQMTEDRDRMNKIQRTVLQLQTVHKVQSGAAITDENVVEGEEIELTNHLIPYDSQASSSRDTAPVTGKRLPGTNKEDDEAITTSPMDAVPAQTKLTGYDLALEVTKGLLGNLSEHVTAVENKVMLLSQKQMLDSQLLQLQQSFMNFTSQVYHLQHWRATSAARVKDVEDEEYQTQHENDMASVIFHLENHSERIRALESLALKHHQGNHLVQQQFNASLVQMNTTFEKALREILEQPRSHDGQQLVMEGRVKVVEEELRETYDRVKDVELGLMNATLAQCRSVKEKLTEEAKSGNYVKQIADVQMKISEQTTSIARLDRGLAGIFQELDKNAGTSSSLAEQVTDLKKLSPEVVSMQRELLNFVLQLPTDCYDVPAATGNSIHDGVYLIRPEVSRQSARTFCLVDEDQVVWTVIQRRTDGRESFARTWDDYRQGFGDAGGEFWLGNENIHRLTDGARLYRLRIDMWDVLGRYWLADYTSFRIHGEDALYRLEVGDFSGNATDAMHYSNLMPFSALDRDNDVSTTHCAQFYQSGWWYKHCHYSNLNGRYTAGMVWFHHDLDEWIQMKQTTMRISMVMGSASPAAAAAAASASAETHASG